MAGDSPQGTDTIVPFDVEGSDVRGRLVRLGPALADLLSRHAYPPAVAGMLGESLALSALLSSTLKFDGTFILQTQGDGPVPLIVTNIASDGTLRGYARFDEDALDGLPGLPEAPVPRLLGDGHLGFTVDQGPDTQRYQGVTALDGATLADCAHHYFHQSEQLETAVMLAADPATGAAAGLLLQRMPERGQNLDPDATDEAWRTALALVGSLSRAELLDPSLPPARLLFRLFHEAGLRMYDPRPLRFGCRCSRQRVADTLRSMPRDQLRDLAHEDGAVTVACEFCGAEYVFDEAALQALHVDNDNEERTP